MLPVVAIGHPVLKKKAQEIGPDYPDLPQLIEKMFETMYASRGVGLAGPQVNKSIRLFVVDASPYGEEDPDAVNFKAVFINPVIVKESGEPWVFCEGCLSIPGVNEDVSRLPVIELEYYDENFQKHKKEFKGMVARIIQHEYDHLEGVLFTDRLSTLKKTLLRGKVGKISKGEVDVSYRMMFPNKK